MAVINGDNDSEIIYGTDSRDIIDGNGGSDDIYGFGGDDDLYGGSGGDDLYGGAGRDWLWGDSGVNNLWGGSGADRFISSFIPNSFSDDWIGDFQLDVDRIDVSAWGVSDFSQLDALFRTDGNGDAWLNAFYNGYDHYLTINGVGAGELISSDFIYSNAGAQNDSGTQFDDVMFGSRFNDVLGGANGNDILLGGFGNDILNGGQGNDRIIGGAGADLIVGSRGRDILAGDGAGDTFDFNNVLDSRVGRFADVITDFQPGIDTIDVSGIDAVTGAGNQAFDWIGGAAFTAAGQLRYGSAGGDTVIYGSTDADAAAEFQIVLDGNFALVRGDFIL